MLDEKTIYALKLWLDYRKKFHPEIENDPVLSQFVFPYRSASFLPELTKQHFKYLKDKLLPSYKKRRKMKLNKGKPVSPRLEREIALLEKLIKNGAITPHQLRTSWDTYAAENGMRDYLRRFHLNHHLKGMDQVYVKIRYETYSKEFDRAAPKFNIVV